VGERTAGVVVLHAFGHPALMGDLQQVATERGLAVIEDVTGALGASFRGTPAGRMSHRAVFTGRAGDPVTRGAFVIFGSVEEAEAAEGERSGGMSEGEARVALAQLRGLEEELTARRRLAWELRFNIRGMKGVDVMAHGRWVRHSYAVYLARLRSTLWKRGIAETVAAMRAEGIPCELACPAPLHHDDAVRAALPDDPRLEDDALTVATRLTRELIAVPLHANLTSKDMDTVAAVLRKLEARSI
jgi:perosamine synthetase